MSKACPVEVLAVGFDRMALLGGRPSSLLFRRRALFLCGAVPTVRAPGRFGRPAAGSLGSKALCHELGELCQGDLAVAQLGAPLGGGYGDHTGVESVAKPRDQHEALVIRKRGRVGNVPRELDAAVRGVDVLAAWP